MFLDFMEKKAIQSILDAYCLQHNIAAAVIDLNGKVIVKSHWRSVCVDFFRKNKESCKRCIESDTTLANALDEGKEYTLYTCKNGLTDAASPIVVDGEHVANIFIGQFLTVSPDMEFFDRQVERYGFDRDDFMAALSEVAVIPEKELPALLAFLVNFTEIICELGLESMRNHNLLDEVKASESKLRRTKTFLQEIIDSMPAMLIGVDADLNILFAQQCEGGKLGGRLIEAFPFLSENEAALKKVVEERSSLTLRYAKVKVDHHLKYMDITAYPVEMPDGAGGAVVIIVDRTKEREAELMLNHASKMNAVGQLAGGVAHDFNNCLCVILGSAEILRKQLGTLAPQTLNLVDSILAASHNAEELARSLLSFSRKQSGERKLIDAHNLIKDTVSLLRRAGAKNIKIDIYMDAERSMILGHVSSLQNVLMNLGVNACHAMPSGGTLEIRTSNRTVDEFSKDAAGALLSKGEYIEIIFKDFGVGIPDEIKSKIFEPFFTTKEDGKGTGLGLALAYSMIQDHDGAITVDSALGKGASFKIILPLAPSTLSESEPDAGGKEAVALDNGKTILYVDDEELIRISTKLRLEDMGYRVFLAENADNAIEIFKKRKDEIDLILSDMVMPPGMDGEELFMVLKEIKPDVRFAIYSGFFNGYHAKSMMANGLSGFIMKPATEEELRAFVEKALRKRV